MKKFLLSVAVILILATSGTVHAQEHFAVEVLNLVNAERAQVGVPPLRLAADLMNCAAVRAEELTEYFSHTRPDGSNWDTALGYKGHTWGENIAAGYPSAEAVVEGWMNSEGHRRNILNPEFRELGVGYFYSEGTAYKNFWVQNFRG